MTNEYKTVTIGVAKRKRTCNACNMPILKYEPVLEANMVMGRLNICTRCAVAIAQRMQVDFDELYASLQRTVDQAE